jgi:acyl-CoA reductase-like NAD-dependent aldehyde dehydrogenase
VWVTGRVGSAEPYATLPSHVSELVASRERCGIFADGRRLPATETYETVGPADGRVLTTIASATDQDVATVVASALGAASAWRRLVALERGRLVARLADAIRERLEDLATLDAIDSGNPIDACRFDVRQAAELLDYMAGLALEVKGETIPTKRGILDATLREPFGVVGRITAFNHPALFAAKALGAPLVAGNTVIVKPSPWTPLSATVLVEIAAEVLPPGVVNLVTGGAAVAAALARHPDVRRISLTGSVAAGLAVSRAAAETAITTVTLELGGKNALVALADADPDEVAAAVVDGMNLTSSAGQSCGSTSRLLVHASLRDRVVEAAAARMEALRLGDPLDPETRMGPLVSAAQVEKSERYVAETRAAGARLVCGGSRPDEPHLRDGFFYRPTLFDDVDPGLPISNEEVFGPVLIVQPWERLGDAITLANATRYGLTVSVFTNDLTAAMTLARELVAGYVWINGVSHHQLGTPFGGQRDSGTGREDSLGELLSYTQLKNVNFDLSSAIGVDR